MGSEEQKDKGKCIYIILFL